MRLHIRALKMTESIKGNSKRYFFIISFLLLTALQSNSLFAGSAPTADFSVDNATPVVDESVTFTDE